MKTPKYRYFVGDFETTVYKGQVHTEVWASASVEMFTEDVNIFHSISEQFEYFKSLNSHIICYYHNLKFDGNFWLSYLLTVENFTQHIEKINETEYRFLPKKSMKNNSIIYSISDMGQWYSITIKVDNHIIEFRDSLKLLPFSVNKIGKSFGTAHKKLDMEYTGFRFAGCEITEKEKHYIANDVLVVKEALEIMFTEGHKKLTIGSCCLAEYKKSIGAKYYERLFPNLYDIDIDEEQFNSPNTGLYIHNSYHGGWCYLVKGKEHKKFYNGTTADVNSLYPSMMSSASGNIYPTGEPTFWVGDYIPDEAKKPENYFFIRFKTRFYLKPNKLPFIQIKNNPAYKSTEMLETSDFFNKHDGLYYPEYKDFDGNIKQAIVELTMTMVDFKLFIEHYDLVDFVILDGCWFKGAIGIFDTYINKYKKIKQNSKGAKRELAKLFLNNLYGKMASSTSSNFKVAFIKEDKTIGFIGCKSNDKKPGYIAVGSAITSYARNFTIRAAQQNYHGVDKRGFIYADTDSIHCDLQPSEIKGIKVHETEFCCWKLESQWDMGLFVRQKTYIEHIVIEDNEKIDNPYYNVKCAGMPEKCKSLFIKSVEGYEYNENDNYTPIERNFLSQKRKIEDFDIGLCVPGKLLPKRIRGGVLLVDTLYQMR